VYLFPTPLFISESFFQDLWELFRLMSKIVFFTTNMNKAGKR